MQHAALFQRLGQPLTLIRLQNEAFRKRLLFRFRVDEKIELFANDDVTMMMRSFLQTGQIVAFLNYSGVG